MTGERIVILGGYGNTGRAVARLLLEHSTADLVLAGRDPAKANRAAEELNRAFGTARVRGAEADASRSESLRPVLDGASIVVAASSTSAHAAVVGRAVLDAGADYMDPQYSTRKLDVLRGLEASIEAAGRCFVTDAGFHPGLPAALVRYAAGRLPSIRRAAGRQRNPDQLEGARVLACDARRDGGGVRRLPVASLPGRALAVDGLARIVRAHLGAVWPRLRPPLHHADVPRGDAPAAFDVPFAEGDRLLRRWIQPGR